MTTQAHAADQTAGAVAWRCRCGTLQGWLRREGMVRRATCYCRDCQAYARFLGCEETVLDACGGTAIVATYPRNLQFTAGLPALACMSLSEKGLLRWYASCCNTPVGNTPRDRRLPYVGVVQGNLFGEAGSVERAFGPLRMKLNTGSARCKVKSTPLRTLVDIVGLMVAMVSARVRGDTAINPFFEPGGAAPVRQPRVLTRAERAQATPGGLPGA